MEQPIVSEDEMMKEAELFFNIFSVFIHEMDQIERTRGKVNEFQLMQAFFHAKDTVGILGWERRQTVNAIFEKYMHIFRELGRHSADEWVSLTFGFRFDTKKETEPVTGPEMPTIPPDTENRLSGSEETSGSQNAEPSIEELSLLILEKEAELLQLYRAFYKMKRDS
ncbi:hypothetical protein [Paenibacillus humicola]|uniref:hypothetical protein n=1 Tax=Paenibacillus humicola TaxID=3110540 RepID=UPI00237BAE6C|nr:hypothetical protein [Paenibacillus humicola]